jgi:hypothetical protein
VGLIGLVGLVEFAWTLQFPLNFGHVTTKVFNASGCLGQFGAATSYVFLKLSQVIPQMLAHNILRTVAQIRTTL